jgi:sarcosine oxidase
VTEAREIVVVGAGLLGLAASRELAARGHDVLCLEQARVGHDRSGSKSSSRIFRLGYPDAAYVRLAERAREGWRDLESRCGYPLLTASGLLTFGSEVRQVLHAMTSAGVPPEQVGPADVSARFPDFSGAGPALFEAEAGILAADLVLRALASTSQAELRQEALVGAITPLTTGARLETADGPIIAGVLVLCGGAWSSHLARLAGIEAAADALVPSLQQVAYFGHRSGALPSDPLPPCFIEWGTRMAYGLPTPALGTYKIGIHQPGSRVDPDEAVLVPEPVDVAWLEEAAARLLPGYVPVAVATERCFYDNSPDEHFVLDRIGDIVIGAGTSGHGFKFGPVLGEILADLAESADLGPPAERYSLRRFLGADADRPGA